MTSTKRLPTISVTAAAFPAACKQPKPETADRGTVRLGRRLPSRRKFPRRCGNLGPRSPIAARYASADACITAEFPPLGQTRARGVAGSRHECALGDACITAEFPPAAANPGPRSPDRGTVAPRRRLHHGRFSCRIVRNVDRPPRKTECQ